MNAADLSGGKLSGGGISERTAKLSGGSSSGNTALISARIFPHHAAAGDSASKRSSASYETERSLAEIESGSITFHHHPSSLLDGGGAASVGSSTFMSGAGLKNAPSLHETHFSVEGSDSPLTILHPPGKFLAPIL